MCLIDLLAQHFDLLAQHFFFRQSHLDFLIVRCNFVKDSTLAVELGVEFRPLFLVDDDFFPSVHFLDFLGFLFDDFLLPFDLLLELFLFILQGAFLLDKLDHPGLHFVHFLLF